jgi:hypothetical protein
MNVVMMSISGPSDPSREQEYNDWYDNVHVPEVLETPGSVSARRLRLADTQMAASRRWRADDERRARNQSCSTLRDLRSDLGPDPHRRVTRARLRITLHSRIVAHERQPMAPGLVPMGGNATRR